jgi:hypothetical protein
MSTLELKELSHPSGEVIKIAAGKTLDLKSQGTTTLPTGSVLQVVHATGTSAEQTTSSTYQNYSGSNATITPTSTTSKILVLMEAAVSPYNNSGANAEQSQILYKNGVALSRSFPSRMYDYGATGGINGASSTINYLDSPSTTSALTYQLYYKWEAGTYARVFGASITLMEIQG